MRPSEDRLQQAGFVVLDFSQREIAFLHGHAQLLIDDAQLTLVFLAIEKIANTETQFRGGETAW